MRNIYLTGFMGAGKSAVGRKLASCLGQRFVDLDVQIVDAVGKSISDIFASDGEEHFRELETSVLEVVASACGQVVATGGGAVIAPKNRRLMRESGVVVNLTATRATIMKRLAGDNSRPLLQGENPDERIKRMLDEREQFYVEADFVVMTDDRTVDDIVAEIIAKLVDRI